MPFYRFFLYITLIFIQKMKAITYRPTIRMPSVGPGGLKLISFRRLFCVILSSNLEEFYFIHLINIYPRFYLLLQHLMILLNLKWTLNLVNDLRFLPTIFSLVTCTVFGFWNHLAVKEISKVTWPTFLKNVYTRIYVTLFSPCLVRFWTPNFHIHSVSLIFFSFLFKQL